MSTLTLQHGCRSEYGPLELRIQSSASANGFQVFVEDLRKEGCIVYQQDVQGTLESAKEYVTLRAHEYLNSYAEEQRHEPDWRCS
jgi:hypothetical protein